MDERCQIHWITVYDGDSGRIRFFAYFGNSVFAQTLTDVYSFSGTGSSQNPSYVTPTQGRDGQLYGTTYGLTFGSVFKVTTVGSADDLHAFAGSDGANPIGGLTLSTDGNFYGTTSFGGSANLGVLFKIARNGTYTVLHEFTGGSDGARDTLNKRSC